MKWNVNVIPQVILFLNTRKLLLEKNMGRRAHRIISFVCRVSDVRRRGNNGLFRE